MNQTLRPFETHEGAATRKVKTVSEGAPPSRMAFLAGGIYICNWM